MKVLDLQCTHGHGFEGWFGSEDDFQGQLARQLVECPICGDTGIAKRLSAPRLNLGAEAPRQPVAATPDARQQAEWLKLMRQVMASTEDVGERFAEEARRMHYGEAGERAIRGQASPEETRALLEEGIPVLPLPVPKALKEPLQ
ncbi:MULTISPECIES: DUF1178 family protein [Ramlibacter]|uniref:DUF1178 family protein n=1 Tax=Ramlibacter aquaticus TaxID=2780094 RepID=A0ABR9SEG5_9BURK|nr:MULTISPECIES: DUF1178 family protein [Ramlibacter]MBE7940751.1 DUF1178 family protein [Ramlibacter aquaticus]